MKSKKFIDKSFVNSLKIQDLRMIITLHKQGTILRTADVMQLSQPAITKRLQDLEKDLGISLFHRMSRGVEPTPYGDILIKHAHIVLNQIRHAEGEVSDLSSGKGGRLRIGVPVAAAAELVAEAVSIILSEREDIQITIEEDYNIRLIPSLKQGNLDLIIGRLPIHSLYDDIKTTELYKEELKLVVRKEHPLADRKKIVAKNLTEYRWMMPLKDSIIYKQIEDYFRENTLQVPKASIHSLSQVATVKVLKSNDLIAAFPAESINEELASGELVALPIKLATADSPIGIITREEGFVSPATEKFIEILFKLAKKYNK